MESYPQTSSPVTEDENMNKKSISTLKAEEESSCQIETVDPEKHQKNQTGDSESFNGQLDTIKKEKMEIVNVIKTEEESADDINNQMQILIDNIKKENDDLLWEIKQEELGIIYKEAEDSAQDTNNQIIYSINTEDIKKEKEDASPIYEIKEEKMEIMDDIKIEDGELEDAFMGTKEEMIDFEDKDWEEETEIAARNDVKKKSCLRPKNICLYYCSICGNLFRSATSFKYHVKFHTEENLLSCEICGKKFPWKSSLECHTRTHTREKPYECDICHLSFTQNDLLQNHLRTHLREKPKECNICHKTFTHKAVLSRHLELHRKEKQDARNICLKAFTLKHCSENRHHNLRYRSNKCKVCHRSFARYSNLKKHILVHRRRKPFECNNE